MAQFKKIKQTTRLADEVYEQIYDSISLGSIAPNERIVQEKLADEMQVSRTPVREALLRLEVEGVLVRSGRHGFVFRRFSSREAHQIYDVRELVECYAMGQLWDKKDSEMISRLEQNTIRIESKNYCNFNEFGEANKSIHRAFVNEVGNPFLLDLFDMIWTRSNAIRAFSALSAIDLTLSIKGHMELCQALRVGNRPDAIEAMRLHIREGLNMQLSTTKN